MGRFSGMFCLFLALCALVIGVQPLQAEHTWSPIQIIIPAAPGDGGAPRLIAEELTKILKTPVVAVNSLGAAVSALICRKSKKDITPLYGWLLPTALLSGAILPRPIRDLEPVSDSSPRLLVAGITLKSFQRLLNTARRTRDFCMSTWGPSIIFNWRSSRF
jgi:tripartite-type tricarboxylate transporter receptor subunit TctC